MNKTSKLIILALLAGLLTACAAPQTDTTTTPAPAPVSGFTAEGTIVPANTLDQAFGAPGQIAEVLVKDGDLVTRGQVLARMAVPPEVDLALARAKQEMLAAEQASDALETQASLNLAQAKLAVLTARDALEQAQDRYDNNQSEMHSAEVEIAAASLALAEKTQTELAAGAGIDGDTAAAAGARMATSQAALAAAQAALDAHSLTASTNGTVTSLSIQPGQYISAGEPVLTLADYSTWQLQTDSATELDVPGVEPGDPVEISLDALPGVVLAGEVVKINPRAEEKRGDVTYTVTIRLVETRPQMRWGMTASVNFLP